MENVSDRKFFQRDLLKIIGVPRMRFEQWLSHGYIHPSIEKATGPGFRNVFSFEDICRVALFKMLLEAGYSRKEAARFANAPMIPKEVKFPPKWEQLFPDQLERIRKLGIFVQFLTMWKANPENPMFLVFVTSEKTTEMFPLFEKERFWKLCGESNERILIVNIKEMIKGISEKVGERPRKKSTTLLTK